MIVVFDMDNTLTDDFGGSVRPGIIDLLQRLKADGIELAVWTHSKRERAQDIISFHKLDRFFSHFVFREDYAPEGSDQPKDIRRLKAQFLVDDDPKQIQYVKSIKRDGFLITSFRGGLSPDPAELEALYQAIRKAKRRIRLFGWVRFFS